MRTERTEHGEPGASGPEATAIVVTHQSEAHIADCLTALRGAGLAVQVVDNASTDGTARLLATRFPTVPRTLNVTNIGFSAAVNQALATVDSDIVLLVNPDCVLPAGTARALLALVRARPDVGIAGPRLVGANGRVAISAHPFESLTTVLTSRFGGSLMPVGLRRLLSGRTRRQSYDACRNPGPPVPVDWVSGACMAVRTGLLKQLGGLDEGYFMYYEDEELCWQARRLGARVFYVPEVQAIHVGGASSTDPSWGWPHLYRSMLRFFARHRRRSYPLVRAAVLIRALLGIGLAVVRRREQYAAAGRAWRHVARIALSATSGTMEREGRCTF
jgi:N-acetylglucosaminyl-diphospho-decaprenol L-rhamnosyltransferase